MNDFPDEIIHLVLSALPQDCIHQLQVCKLWQHIGVKILQSRSKIPELYDDDLCDNTISAVVSGACVLKPPFIRKIFSDYYLTIRFGRKFAEDHYVEVINVDNYYIFRLIGEFIINVESKHTTLGYIIQCKDTRIIAYALSRYNELGYVDWQYALSDAAYSGNLTAFKLIFAKMQTMDGGTHDVISDINNTNTCEDIYYSAINGDNLDLLNHIHTIFKLEEVCTMEKTIIAAVECSAQNILDAYYKYRKHGSNVYLRRAIYRNQIKSSIYIIDSELDITYTITDDNLLDVLKLATYQKSKYFNTIVDICTSRGIMDYNMCLEYYVKKCVLNSYSYLHAYNGTRIDTLIARATNYNECALLAVRHGSSHRETIKIIRKLLPHMTNHGDCVELICGNTIENRDQYHACKILKLLVSNIDVHCLNRCLYVATSSDRQYVCKRLIKLGATNYNKFLYEKYKNTIIITKWQ